MHATGLLEIATVATAALVLGLLLQRLRQPAIVGYIVAGVALGPSALGLVVDDKPVRIFAELGVLMLLFVIGMEMSLRGFRRVLRLAVSAAALQIVLSVAVMLIVTRLFDRSMEIGIVLGFVVALSSTAVAIKLLEDIGELRTDIGRTAISVLIAQDLAVVPMLLIVNGLASGDGMPLSGYAKLVAAIGLLALMIVVLTRRERVGLPFARVVEGNIELTAITALAYCFGAALLSALVGLSAAYGAFLAGLWIGNSTARTSILQAALPIQSVLLMMFFLSIGLLLDLTFIWEHLGEVLVLLLVVTLFKTAMNVGILRLVGEPWPRAWIAGIVIGQIGEFSFVLIAAAMAAGLTDEAGGKLAMSVIALSLMLSPLWLITARRLGRLVWNNITGFGQIWAGIYGEEAHAVVVVTQRTARFSMRMGSQGVEAIRHLLPGHEQPETESKDTDKDAGFEESSPKDATDDAAEAPKSEDETKP